MVTGADVSDNTGGITLLEKIAEQFPSVRAIWCDQGFKKAFTEHAASLGIDVVVICRQPGTTGFTVLPRRWVMERFFAWITRARRLARDYERTITSAVAMVQIAYSRMMLRRLTRTLRNRSLRVAGAR